MNGRYKTVAGDEVKIYAIYPNNTVETERVHGAVFIDGKWIIDCWSLDGFCYESGERDDDNLVELANTDPKFWKRNKPLMVSLVDEEWFTRHFYKVNGAGAVLLYANGCTSFTKQHSTNGKVRTMELPKAWREPTKEELK